MWVLKKASKIIKYNFLSKKKINKLNTETNIIKYFNR